MAALRGLLLALLPGVFSIHDHSPLIQELPAGAAPPSEKSAANLTNIPQDWPCDGYKQNLCMPREACKEAGGVEFRDSETNCPLELPGGTEGGWVCCRLRSQDQKDKLAAPEDHRGKRRLANWADWRMKNKQLDDEFETRETTKCGATHVEWLKWFSAGCLHVCEGDTDCIRSCKQCKSSTAKTCSQWETQQKEIPKSYSLTDEICHIAISEEKQICDKWYTKSVEVDRFMSSSEFCEEQDDCEKVCKAECNRCVRDKARHECTSCEKTADIKKGCEHLCYYTSRKPAKTSDQKERLERLGSAIDLMNSYTSQRWSFHEWVIEFFEKKRSRFPKYGQTCRIYFDRGDEKERVCNIAVMREPVNRNMNEWGYSQMTMRHSFTGWSGSAYDDQAQYDQVQGDAGKLPPNIAIGCNTPVFDSGAEEFFDLNWRTDQKVHILNVIWPMLDSKFSPDFAYFVHKGEFVSIDKLQIFYSKVLAKIVAAARHNKAKYVFLDGFGLDKARMVEDHNQHSMEVAFTQALTGVVEMLGEQKNKKKQEQDNGDVAFYLITGSFTRVWEILDNLDKAKTHMIQHMIRKTEGKYDAGDPLNFMDELRTEAFKTKSDSGTVLYVSSWDAYSFIGRGNANDDSMNGKVGLATALAVLGWPKTNPYMQLADVGKEMKATIKEETCN